MVEAALLETKERAEGTERVTEELSAKVEALEGAQEKSRSDAAEMLEAEVSVIVARAEELRHAASALSAEVGGVESAREAFLEGERDFEGTVTLMGTLLSDVDRVGELKELFVERLADLRSIAASPSSEEAEAFLGSVFAAAAGEDPRAWWPTPSHACAVRIHCSCATSLARAFLF